jgi:hypothetical protein
MVRHLLDWLKFTFRVTFGLSALLIPGIILMTVVYPPIQEAVLLRSYYAPEEIERSDLRVMQIVAKREIVFSNGDRRTYETIPKLMCTGIALGLSAAWFGVMCWGIASLNRRRPVPRQRKDDGRQNNWSQESRHEL